MGEDDVWFLAIGEALVSDLVELARLTPDSAVLDMGSGYGRVAHALLRWGFRGDYLGVDILPKHVRWCQEHLQPLRFEHLDIKNDRYNPSGALSPSDVRFSAADVVNMTSVFTHMYPDDVVHYLSELRRTLRGRALVTFFALDDEWAGGLTMDHRLNNFCRVHNPDDPLHAIGYDVRWIRETVAANGLEIAAERLGTWCRRPAGVGYQDVFVLQPEGGDNAALPFTRRGR